MVGVSGCGKSTWVEEFVKDLPQTQNVVVCSADDGHMYDDGAGGLTYVFNPAKAPMAHSDCLYKFTRAIGDPSVTHVIVDNTNVSTWERQNYAEVASLFEAKIVYLVWQCETIQQVKLCASRNKHNVPAGVIADMALRYEKPIGHIIYQKIQ